MEDFKKYLLKKNPEHLGEVAVSTRSHQRTRRKENDDSGFRLVVLPSFDRKIYKISLVVFLGEPKHMAKLFIYS